MDINQLAPEGLTMVSVDRLARAQSALDWEIQEIVDEQYDELVILGGRMWTYDAVTWTESDIHACQDCTEPVRLEEDYCGPCWDRHEHDERTALRGLVS